MVLIFDPRPSTNQSTSLKSGSLFLVMVSVRPSILTYVRTKHQASALVDPWAWIIVPLKSC